MENEIDEGLYSRQLYVLGKKAMQEISRKRILITGINGLGLEVAKNVILSGVSQVTLHDTQIISSFDLSSYFYGNIDDIGRNRAEVCHQHLCEINEYVKVDWLKEQLSENLISHYDILVLCDSKSNIKNREINEWCRRRHVKFILGSVRGLFGSIFCDFGDDYIVNDISGTEPEAIEIYSIEKSKEGLIYVSGDKGHGFCDESLVVFEGVKGMTELNNRDPIIVSINDYRSFYVGNTENYHDHIRRTGIVTEIFLPKPIKFKPYSYFCETLPKFNEIVMSDYGKMKIPTLLHVCFYSLNEYWDKYAELPRSWNSVDANKFEHIFNENATKFHLDKIVNPEMVKIFSYVARGNLNPIHANIGGIVAQEVLKAASQQFNPITQWYYNDFAECLMENFASTVDSDIYQSTGGRYDGQIAVFGCQFQEKLENLRYFLIGAGAIGCEMLKNFAMIGIGTGVGGKVVVTDMDFIERSNLNRQFLFRNWDIGQSKSLTATKAVLKMNPSLHIEAHENRLGPETEDFYNNKFFRTLDCVVNALDNVEAREYAASRIEFNGCAMVDSGTMGPQASQQVIIPNYTKSYKSQQAQENSFPICTLKNFPYQIEHTIQWAKDLFMACFTSTPKLVNIYTKDKPEFYKTVTSMSNYQKFDTVNQILSFLNCIPKSFDHCVEWALNEWFCYFSKNIQQVLHSFPPDHKTAEGVPFWSGTKRVPRFEEFSVDKPHHFDFVKYAAKLRARLFNIEIGSEEHMKTIAKSFQFEHFTPSSEVQIAADDSEIDKTLDLALLTRQMEKLRNLQFKEVFDLHPQDFEKDDDSNFHIDFITAASNMRAYNYMIDPVDKLKTKKIAGNIIPAIATTTSVISGQVCMELFKLAQGHTNIRKYRDSYLNLASPVFTMTIPELPKSYEILGKTYTIWSHFEVHGDVTLREFLAFMKRERGFDLTCVTYKTGVLYAMWFDKDYMSDIMDRLITDIIRNKINQQIGQSETIIPLHIAIEDDNGDDIEGVPVVRYHF